MGQPQYEFIDEEQMQRDIIEEVKLLDSKTLRLVHSMMKAHAIERDLVDADQLYNPDGTPIDMDVFHEELQESLEAARRGEFVTLEDFKKETEEWLSTTK